MRVGPGSISQIVPIAAAAPTRWSDAERAALYLHVLGAPGGTAGDVQGNRAFADLWLRFVAAVTQFSQRHAGPDNPWTVASREFAAAALPRIDAAWAQRDMWNVIDQVNTAELGGAANAVRHRSLAETGGAVLEWVSAHRDGAGDEPIPDRSLADAVARWIAVTVTADDGLEALAQPRAAATRVAEWSQALFSALAQPPNDHGPQTGTPRRMLALFEGAAGSGKTLAAHWLATSIGSVVQRVDLAQVVSKYAGETERNLDRIFSSARESGAVLLFDEADALFGRRSDVHDAHDRYANIEAGYLLQRLERHDGVTIVTTHAATRINPAPRELAKAVVVAFPLPRR